MFDVKNIGPSLSQKKAKRMIRYKTSTNEEDSYIGRMIHNSRNHLYSDFIKENIPTCVKNVNRCSEIIGSDKLIKCRQFYQNSLKALSQNESAPIKLKENYTNENGSFMKLSYEKSPFYEPKLFKNNDAHFEKYKFSLNSIMRPSAIGSKYVEEKNRTDRTILNISTSSNMRKRTEKLKTFESNIKSLKENYENSSVCKFANSTIEAETYTIKGSKEINQDSIKVGNGVWIVCDGHGEVGHEVSHYIANMLKELYNIYTENETISRNLLTKIFTEAEHNLEESGIDITLSGCTCIMIVHVEDRILCACVGDSVAIAIYDNQDYETISSEHKPGNLQEKKRIEFHGGNVSKTLGKEHIPSSPLRLWGQGHESWGPGLAVSRSFGDKMGQKYGLIYEPEIKSISITKTLRYIVVGSDGLFDQLKPSEIGNILFSNSSNGVRGYGKKKFGCKLVCEIAHSRWVGYADDVSGIVLHL